MKMPKELFCKIVRDERGIDAPWLSAEQTIEDAMGDDTGPEAIGVYRLVEIKTVRRKMEIVSIKRNH